MGLDTGSFHMSCERPICSTLVSFIPLFGGLVALPCVVSQPRQGLSQTRCRDDGNATPNGAHKKKRRLGVVGDAFVLISATSGRLAGERGVLSHWTHPLAPEPEGRPGARLAE